MWIPPLIGFLAGGIFLRCLDLVLPHPGHPMKDAEVIHTSWRRSVLLVWITSKIFPRAWLSE